MTHHKNNPIVGQSVTFVGGVYAQQYFESHDSTVFVEYKADYDWMKGKTFEVTKVDKLTCKLSINGKHLDGWFHKEWLA